MSVESDVRESLRSVEDPEMKISVIELGLIYEIRSEDKDGGTHIEAVSYTHLTLPTNREV